MEKLIPKTIKYLSLGRKIPLHNNGTPVRNWLHASDTANAIITIIEKGVPNLIYNIAGHFEQSNLTTVKKIVECYTGLRSSVSEFICEEKRPGQDLRYALNDTRLRKLGWCPKKVFDEELPKIVQYYKENFIW